MTTGQSKMSSFWEANANTIIGLLITLISSPFIYQLVGMKYTPTQIVEVTALFTVISVARGYVVRRIFNKQEEKKETKMQEEIEFWKSVVKDQQNMFSESRKQALILIHGYKVDLDYVTKQYNELNMHYNTVTLYSLNKVAELTACKKRFQDYVADMVENTKELNQGGSSGKQEIEEQEYNVNNSEDSNRFNNLRGD